MGRIEIETFIQAPIERVFDLARSIDLHVVSAAETRERPIAGKTSGLIGPGDWVEWEGVHFGFRQRLRSRITGYDRPRFFSDEQVRGIFKRFNHDHRFIERDSGTVMQEIFEFMAPCAWLVDGIVARHLREFLIQRNVVIKRVAESEEWRKYINAV